MTIAVQPNGRSEFDRIPMDGEDSSKESWPTSSSSSIGKNSDGEDSSGEKEVQSAYKGSICSVDSLEEALPIRKGLSSYYQGKSKSFTSLPETTTSCKCASDFAKPDNAYARRRRNELAKKMYFKTTDNVLRTGGKISKKDPSGRSASALAAAKKHKPRPPLYPTVRTSDDCSPNISSSTRSLSL